MSFTSKQDFDVFFVLSKKRSKFANKKTEMFGLFFDSLLESKIYSVLLSFDKVKKVNLHEKIAISLNDIHICNVIVDYKVDLECGDFFYADAKAESRITETAESRLKFRLVEAQTSKKVWILPRELRMLQKHYSF